MPVDVLAKDRNNNNLSYNGIDTIRMRTTDGKSALFFLEGTGHVVGVEKTVELAMASGDQIVEADTGTLMSKVTIKKPETLVPENIKVNTNIAGVSGTLKPAESCQLDLMVNYGAGIGAVVIEPDWKTIRVYCEHTSDIFDGVLDVGYSDDLYRLRHAEDINTTFAEQLNTAGVVLTKLGKEKFNAIFTAGEAVRVHGVICDAPKITGSITTWNGFMDMLYNSISNISNNFYNAAFVDHQSTMFSGDTYNGTAGWCGKFPFEWQSVNKSGEKYMAGYQFADLNGTMPTYESGMNIISGEYTVGAVNANTDIGVTSNFVYIAGNLINVDAAYLKMVWYSYGDQTLPEALLKQIDADWSSGSIDLKQGWNITIYGPFNADGSESTDGSYNYITQGGGLASADVLNSMLDKRYLNSAKLPYDKLDDYMKSMFAPVYEQGYEVVDKFLLEFNLTHKASES